MDDRWCCLEQRDEDVDGGRGGGSGACGGLTGCSSKPRVGDMADRRGDEIVVAGRYFHTGTPVVLWMDAGGYDGYRTERRFVPRDQMAWEMSKEKLATPARYGIRAAGLTDEEFERVRGGGWTLEDLRARVDQFVIHYDVCGVSRDCFRVLHDARGLSVHFMLDIDGTIYQTLDVKERAFHATIANDRSVGIEIANMGAYPKLEGSPLEKWYARDEAGRWRVTLPGAKGDGGVRTAGFVGYPERLVTGELQGQELTMFDLTKEQYEALIKLTAALHRALPGIGLEYPRGAEGGVDPQTLSPEAFASFKGMLGHWHIQKNKVDPGPAFDWDRVIEGAKRELE